MGDAIQGRFKTKVTYPPPKAERRPSQAHSPDQPDARTSTEFKTQRPIFADQDLERRLADQGVAITAVDESASSWLKLLVSFGPTLLLIAAFVWISGALPRRPAAGCSASAGAAPSGTAKSSRRSPSTTSRGSTRPRTS